MATTSKILGQSKPSATTLTDLYTVGAGNQAQVNLFITNQDTANDDTVRVSVAIDGAADATSQYIAHGLSVPYGKTVQITGICMDGTDKLRVYSVGGYCSFVAMGLEIT